jgi:hypothetical protein
MSYFLVSTSNGQMRIKPVATYPLNTDPTLLLYYTFETTNGVNLLNNKTGLYDASLSNSNIVTTANKKNGSQSGIFNGTYLTLPSIIYGIVNSANTGFTVSCWINVNTVTSSIIWQLGDGNGSGSPAWNGNLGLSLSNSGLNMGSFYHGINNQYSASISTGVWYHIVNTFSTSLQSVFYVNGVLYQTFTNAGSRYPFANSPVSYCLLGTGSYDGSVGAFNTYFNGYVDDFRFYNRVLSASEVASLYTYK